MESQKTTEPSTVFDAVSKRAVDAAIWVATAVMIALLVLIVSNAAIRTTSGVVIPSAFEIGMTAMPILVFLALPWTFYEKRNYRLDVLYGLFRSREQRVIDLLQSLLYLAIATVWSYGTVIDAIHSTRILEYLPGSLKLPVYPARIAISVGCVLVVLVLLRELDQKIRLLFDPTNNSMRLGAPGHD